MHYLDYLFQQKKKETSQKNFDEKILTKCALISVNFRYVALGKRSRKHVQKSKHFLLNTFYPQKLLRFSFASFFPISLHYLNS